jgi:hypothetical protein
MSTSVDGAGINRLLQHGNAYRFALQYGATGRSITCLPNAETIHRAAAAGLLLLLLPPLLFELMLLLSPPARIIAHYDCVNCCVAAMRCCSDWPARALWNSS